MLKNQQQHPGLNYSDVDRRLREKYGLKTSVCENIQNLKLCGVLDWIDIDTIWNRHQHKLANHADALTLLASLEINLKVQERSA